MKNTSWAVLLLALVSVSSVRAIPAVRFAEATSNKLLMRYLMKPQSFAVSPAITAQCFNLYLPILTNVANTFSVQYQACLSIASQRAQTLNTQATANQTTFISEITAVCTSYKNCDVNTQMLDFFNCYAAVSNQDVPVVYTVGIDASAAANSLSQGLQAIQVDENTCTNTTEQTYVSDTASTYTLLDNCLLNGLPSSVATTVSPLPLTDTTGPSSTSIA